MDFYSHVYAIRFSCWWHHTITVLLSHTSSTKPQKDSGYAWLILAMSYLVCFVYTNGNAISGVVLLELSHVHAAGVVESNVAATMGIGVLMCSCK